MEVPVQLCNNLPVSDITDNIIKIKINGVIEEAHTTRYVVEQLTARHKYKYKNKYKCKSEAEIMVSVSTNFAVPVGCGFGASGAGALSTAFALNELLSLNMTLNSVAQIAHCAEVKNRTGLGDVIAETYGGGVVIRKKPGPPGIGMIDLILHRNEKISYVVLGIDEKRTKTVLTEAEVEGSEMKRRINEAGRVAMKKLMRRPTLETFISASHEFALQSELISSICKDVIEAVAADGKGKIAGVAMLGEAVFVIGDSEALTEFGMVQESRISNAGVSAI